MFNFLANLFGTGGPKWSGEEVDLFRETALAAPGDSGPRLRLADALEKRGEALGEYIRLTHEAEALPEGGPRRAELDQRLEELLAAHGKRWCQPLRRFGLKPDLMGHFYPPLWMTLGVFDTLTLDRPGILPEHAAGIFAAMPGLRKLEIVASLEHSHPDIAGIVEMPEAKQLTELQMPGIVTTLDDLRAIADSPHLKNLRVLNIQGSFGAKGGQLIARSRSLRNLRSLMLHSARLGDEGAVALAGSANLAGVTELTLEGGMPLGGIRPTLDEEDPVAAAGLMGPRGAAALAGSPHLAAVRSLNLSTNRVGAAGVAALAGSPRLRPTTLNLGHNTLDADAGPALASAAWLAGVTDLDLGNNALGDGIAGLKASRLTSLRRLELTFNGITGKGLTGLLTAKLPVLTELSLGVNQIGPDGAQALASAELPALRKLDLGANPLGDAGAQLLATAPVMETLTYLNLGNCGIGPAGARALAGNPRLRNLRELHLGDNEIGTEGAKALASAPHLSSLTNLCLGPSKLSSSAEDLLRERFGSALTIF